MAAHSITVNRAEVTALADRLAGRAASKLMDSTPEAQSDMRTAALVLRAAVSVGFPVTPLSVDYRTLAAAIRALPDGVPAAEIPARLDGLLAGVTSASPAAPTRRVLGYPFRAMTEGDRETFAGASDGAQICEGRGEGDDFADTVLLWDPQEQVLSEIAYGEDGEVTQRNWRYAVVVGDGEVER